MFDYLKKLRKKEEPKVEENGTSSSEQTKGSVSPVTLIILDGFGVAPESKGNAISQAKMPYFESLKTNYPYKEIIASGESVGLPANEVGNTEVGHLTIGAGRVILQSLERINKDIENGLFFQNKAFLQTVEHVKKNNSALHLIGLVGNGNVHSSLNHLYSLLKFCKQREVGKVFIHAITDGRDSPPDDGAKVIAKLEEYLSTTKVGRIASVSGRYYAMDRDKRWERIQKAYDSYVLGKGISADSAGKAIADSYARKLTDEFIEPTVITESGKPVGLISDGDAVIFFNFRIDRPRQLTMSFVLKDFENLKSFDFGYMPEAKKTEGEVKIKKTFKREKVPQNLFFTTMTEYQKNIPVSAIAFGEIAIKNSLPEVISNAGLKQLRLSESEKEKFVTFYLSGFRDERYKGEDRIIIPSPKVATYDKKPEMSVYEIAEEFEKAISKKIYNLIVVNLANPDMVAHSGNVKKAIKALEHVDKALNKIIDSVISNGGTALITSDHGNVEEMLSYKSKSFFVTSEKGDRNTDHSNNPVPLVFVGNKFKGVKVNIQNGSLSDVAPTILTLMNIPIPPEMTGKDLLGNPESNGKNSSDFEIYY